MTDNKIYSALADKEKDSSVMRDMAEMFGLSDNISIRDVNISQLNENAHHPFKVNDDKKLQMLAESIRKDGQMNPIVIRLLQNGRYEILSGHRRTKAIESIGKKTIRAIVVDVDDETANRILINTNFSQRDIVLPSEIAKSYLLRYNDLKKTRNSNGWNPEDGKLDEILAKEFHASKSSVYTVILNVTKFVMYPEKLTVTAPVDSVFETGNTIPLSCSFYPENTNQFGLYWTADGAIIDQSGRLTITDRGRVTVRVHSQNRRVFAEYEIDAKYSKDSFKEVKTLSNLSKTKSVRLKFDKPADAQSARDNIFANKSADANGEDIPINIVVNENIVTVTPTGEWTDDCGIFIKPGLCAADGEKTGQDVKVLISLRRSNK